jgi:hypothetical protein
LRWILLQQLPLLRLQLQQLSLQLLLQLLMVQQMMRWLMAWQMSSHRD